MNTIPSAFLLGLLLHSSVGAWAAEISSRPGVLAKGVRIPITKLIPEAIFQIPGTPDWIAIDEGVWVSNEPKDSVTYLDPISNKVVETITVGRKPCSGLTIGFGSLWVPVCGDQSNKQGLTRIDLKTGKKGSTIPINIANSEGGLTTGAGSVWVLTDANGTLVRIDPVTERVIAEIHVNPGSFTAAFGEGAVWITCTDKNLLLRVDPDKNKITATIPVGGRPRFLAIGEGSVWTLNQTDGSVSRIDASACKLVTTIQVGVPGEGGEIAVGGGSVWVTSFEFPITRIEIASNKVVQQFAGEGGDAIRYGHGSVWLSNLKAGNVWRLDPTRVALTKPD